MDREKRRAHGRAGWPLPQFGLEQLLGTRRLTKFRNREAYPSAAFRCFAINPEVARLQIRRIDCCFHTRHNSTRREQTRRAASNRPTET